MAHFIEIDGVWTQSTDPHDELLTHCKTVAPATFTISDGVALPESAIVLYIIPDEGFAINANDFENKTLSTYNNHPELFNHNPNDWLMDFNFAGFSQGVKFSNTNPDADSIAWIEGNQVRVDVKLNTAYVPTSNMTLQLDFYNKNWQQLGAESRRVTIAFLEPVTSGSHNSTNPTVYPRPSRFEFIPAEGVTHYSASLNDNIPSVHGNPRFKSPQSRGSQNCAGLDLDGSGSDYTYLTTDNYTPYIHYITTDVEIDTVNELAVPKVLGSVNISYDLEYPSTWNNHAKIKSFYNSSVAANPGTQMVFGFIKTGGTDEFETNPAKCVQILPHDNVVYRNNYVTEDYPSKFSQTNIQITDTVSGERYYGDQNQGYQTIVTGISYDLVFTENFEGLKPQAEGTVGSESFDSGSGDLLNSDDQPITPGGAYPFGVESGQSTTTSASNYNTWAGFSTVFDPDEPEPRRAGYWNSNLDGYFWNINYTCGQGTFAGVYSLDVDTGVAPSRQTRKVKHFAIRNIRTNFNKVGGSKSSNMIPSEGITNGKGEITILGDPGARFKVSLKEVESGINDSDTAQTGVSKSGGYATADITASILDGGKVSGMPIGFIKIPSSGAYVINLPEIERLKSRDAFKVFELHLTADSNTNILESALNDGGVFKKSTIQGSGKTSNVSATLINKYYQYPPVGLKFNALNHGGASFTVGYRPIDQKPFGGNSVVVEHNRYGAKPLSKSGETKSWQFRQRKGGATFSINTTVLTPKYAADGTTIAYYSIPSNFFTESIRNNGEKYVIQARAHIGAGLQDTAVTDCTVDIHVRLLKYGKLPQELTIDFKEIFIES